MATVEDLKCALKENLEVSDVLREVKARLQGEVFKELEDKDEKKPSLGNENVLVNELILEYLRYNGYSVTASVLKTESGHPKDVLGRKFLQSELKVLPSPDSNIPLLYYLVKDWQTTPMQGPSTAPAIVGGCT